MVLKAMVIFYCAFACSPSFAQGIHLLAREVSYRHTASILVSTAMLRFDVARLGSSIFKRGVTRWHFLEFLVSDFNVRTMHCKRGYKSVKESSKDELCLAWSKLLQSDTVWYFLTSLFSGQEGIYKHRLTRSMQLNVKRAKKRLEDLKARHAIQETNVQDKKLVTFPSPPTLHCRITLVQSSSKFNILAICSPFGELNRN